jgi:hypothetical protein
MYNELMFSFSVSTYEDIFKLYVPFDYGIHSELNVDLDLCMSYIP